MQSPPPAAAFSIPIASSRIKYMSHLVDPIDKKTKQWQKTSLLNSVPIPLLDQNHPQDCRVSRGQHQHWWGGSLLFNNKNQQKNGKFSFLQCWLNWLNKRQSRRWTSPSWALASWGAGSPSFLRTRLSFLTWTYILDFVVLLHCWHRDLDLYFRSCCSPALLSLLTWTYILQLAILAVIGNC